MGFYSDWLKHHGQVLLFTSFGFQTVACEAALDFAGEYFRSNAIEHREL